MSEFSSLMGKVLSNKSLNDLRRSLAGTIVSPTDAEYDAVRRCFNALIDRRPAVIVRCVDAGDVALAFDFARAHELPLAVRGGGHNPAGHCVCDGGLVIDLSLMRRVEVDGAAQIARADGGTTWLDYDQATQAFGLVTPGGIVGSTGVVGLALGGGIGHLTAQHSLTCDNIIGAEVVTPDGTVIHASADENADLLWGLRGGGGNFGVVRGWSSACTRSSVSWAVSACTAGKASAMHFAVFATSLHFLHVISVARRCSRWTGPSRRPSSSRPA